MRIYWTLDLPKGPGAAVALGFFDGVHLGHRAVISRAVALAGEMGLESGVFSFTINGSSPASKKASERITTPEERMEAFRELGVDFAVCPPFSSFSSLSPEAFVKDVLAGAFNAKAVVCGGNYRFGSHAAGDIDMLRSICAEAGIRVEVVPYELYHGEPISSTRIRGCLRDGDTADADAMLGHSSSGRPQETPNKF